MEKKIAYFPKTGVFTHLKQVFSPPRFRRIPKNIKLQATFCQKGQSYNIPTSKTNSMKKIITYLIILLMSVGVFTEMYSNLNGASSQTAAPGEVTCSQAGCHGSGNGEISSGGLADNMGGGSIVISGIGGTYVPGTTYTITVKVSQLGAGRFGFNAEALDASNGNAGTLTATQVGTWMRQGINGTRNTVSQGHSGSSGPTAGVGTDYFDFTFTWQAPATSVGPVTIWASGVAINQSGLNDSGDQVYSTSLTLNPTTVAAAQILVSRTAFNNPSFYSLASAVGNTQVFWAAGQGLSGNLNALCVGATFRISTSSAGPWTSTLALPATGGVVPGTAIYVQYTGQASGTQTGTVTITGGGAANKVIPLSGVVRTGGTQPAITAPNPGVLNFGAVPVGSGATAPQSFSYTPSNPVASMTITCPPSYEISFVPTREYSGMIKTIFFGIGFPTTLYVRLKNPQVVGTFNGTITIAMPGATTQSVSLTATSTMPAALVLASTDALSLFTTNPGTPSAAQMFSVNGSGLTSNLDVTAPANFEVSLSPSSGFGASVSIAPSGGTVAATTVYARYNNFFAALDAGSITVSSQGAVSQLIYVNADCFGTPTPFVIETGTLTAYATIVGTPSAPQTFTVSGLNLTANLDVNAPTDFEVSLTSGSGYGALVSLPQSGGNVAATVIYARYNPAVAGTTTSTITCTSAGATTQNVPVTGTSTTTGIKTAGAANFSVYPNPSTGIVIVKSVLQTQEMFVSVTDVAGKVILTEKLSSAGQELDLSSYSGGLYFVSVLDADKKIISRQKIVLRK